MKNLGLIEIERLQLIPEKYWKAHEFCFFLHDQILAMLVEYESSGVHRKVVDALQDAAKGHEDKFHDLDVLEFLKEHDLKEPYRHHIIGHVVLALTSDMLHYLYEALRNFEKRKFTVGFTLLRKPLKEHLFYLSWLLADEEDFISRFEKDNYETFSQISKEKRIEIYKKAIAKLAVSDAFDPESIWEIIYSKNQESGFEPTCQRATHLITSIGDLLKTEDYSFNFIFCDPADDDYYEFLYSHPRLPYVLMFIMQVSLEAFNRVSAINEKTFSHLLITIMGTYEALFLDGRSQAVSRLLKRQLKSFLECVHCEEPLKITKKNAANLYISEEMHCASCGSMSQVPLYWIFAQIGLKITRDDLSEEAD